MGKFRKLLTPNNKQICIYLFYYSLKQILWIFVSNWCTPKVKTSLKNLAFRQPKKRGQYHLRLFFVKSGPLCKLHNDALFHPAAQFFQALKNETLTRGASLTTLTTILFTSNNYILLVRPNNFFFKEKRNFPAICSKLMPSSMRPDTPQERGGRMFGFILSCFSCGANVFFNIVGGVGKCCFKFSN